MSTCNVLGKQLGKILTMCKMSSVCFHDNRRLEPISKQRRGRKDDSDSDSYPTSTGTGSSDKSSTKTAKSTPIKKPYVTILLHIWCGVWVVM